MKWPLVKISDFCQTGSGGTPSREVLEFYQGNIPWIKSGDLRENIVTSATEFISDEAIQKSSAKIVPCGAILVAMYGATVGRMALLGIDAATNQAVCNVVPDPSKADTKYVYYALLSKVPDFLRSAIGGAQPNISQGLIRTTEIPLPPLPEQERIAAILDKAHAIRRKRQQAIQLADDFLRAVFLDMFGDVIEGGSNVVRFSDIALLDASMVDPRDEEYSDLIHIGPDRVEKKVGKLLPALTAREEGLISKKFLFDDRYVLYSKIRPYLRKCAMAEGVGLCSADMYPVRPIESVATREFLWMLLLSDFFTAYTESLPARANIPKLNREELEAFTLSLPDYSEQLKFSSIVKATNIASQRTVQSAAYVDGALESLSQKAFSGQL